MKESSFFSAKLSSVAIVATFFALWLSVTFGTVIEDYLGYILILTIGILHGANDIKLMGFSTSKKKKRNSTKQLLIYIGVILLMAVSFFIVPAVALALFVLISAYHFGEQHWSVHFLDIKKKPYLLYIAYGLLIFGMLFSFNAEETSAVILSITSVQLSLVHFEALVVAAIILFGIGIFTSPKPLRSKINWGEEFLLLAVFFVIFHTASLVWAFSIYFVFWHSLPSLHDQVNSIYGSFETKHLKAYIKSSWPYWIISIFGLGLLLLLFKDQPELFLSLFFSFLAAITLPHVLVMHRFFEK